MQLSNALRTSRFASRYRIFLVNSSVWTKQEKQKEEYGEHCECQDEGILASSSQAFVLIFACCAAEVLAHGDRSGADNTVLMLDDYWRGLFLMLRHFNAASCPCFSVRIYSLASSGRSPFSQDGSGLEGKGNKPMRQVMHAKPPPPAIFACFSF